MKATEQIIEEIKKLVYSKGYIYALLMILFEDFHIDLEKSNEINYLQRLSTKESAFLLGFLIQRDLNFSTPDKPEDLIQMRKETYKLMEELHNSFNYILISKLKDSLTKEHKKENMRADQKEFFGHGDMMVEPIFYSGAGAYDIQYLYFLEKKFKYDKKWLLEEKNFIIDNSKEIVWEIKKILNKKSEKVNLTWPKEQITSLIESMKEKYPDENLEKQAAEILPLMEIYQYVELFFDNQGDKKITKIEDIREEGWKYFYKGLIELFTIEVSDFDSKLNVNDFFNNFSLAPKKDINSNLKMVGDYNIISSHPIIKVNENKYLVPNTFLLFEAVYESPYYWMINDKKYKDQAGKNRGIVGEEISYDFLLKIFGIEKTFKSVKIEIKKGQIETDIDVLCVLGSKALCVQVKSKKLTELSRKGNDEQLQKDFQNAVQDAYDQGLISRNRILDKNAKFIDENGCEIKLSEGIDEVYIMVITTENYPSLTHQSDVMLNKKDDDPFPIVLTIFDLELISHYLDDSYDFLYYIKQRILLMDYFKADEEVVFLGFHLDQKLWKRNKVNLEMLDNSFGLLIDRNYYPYITNQKVSDAGDKIKNRWKNEDFNKLCLELKKINKDKITDIIFFLFDWSNQSIENLLKNIILSKKKTLLDGKNHDFSIFPEEGDVHRAGASYLSLNSNNTDELKDKLLTLCMARKYKIKGNSWVGFGSLKDSSNLIDTVIFNNEGWNYNKDLEQLSECFFSKGSIPVRLGKKVGRNDKCPCGSNLKYKHCCGF